MIWIHGGGWQSGDKSNYQPARVLQQRHPEFAIASINYRLSQQAPWPAQLIDCKRAVIWLRDHAAQYGLDPSRFGVWGSSAGGHLASVTGYSNEWSGFTQADNERAKIGAVADYYGPTDFIALVQTPGYEGHASASSAESRLVGGPVLTMVEQVRSANPITYVSKDDPPCFIVHGSADPVVAPGQSDLLASALRAKGIFVDHRVISGAGHGGQQFTAAALIDDIYKFFVKSFKIAPRRS